MAQSRMERICCLPLLLPAEAGRAAGREMRFICLFLNSGNRIHHFSLSLVTELRKVFYNFTTYLFLNHEQQNQTIFVRQKDCRIDTKNRISIGCCFFIWNMSIHIGRMWDGENCLSAASALL